jgi:hypothetical protein
MTDSSLINLANELSDQLVADGIQHPTVYPTTRQGSARLVCIIGPDTRSVSELRRKYRDGFRGIPVVFRQIQPVSM